MDSLACKECPKATETVHLTDGETEAWGFETLAHGGTETLMSVGGTRHISRLCSNCISFLFKVSLSGEAARAWIYLTLCLPRTLKHFTTTIFYLVGFPQ